MPSPRRLWSVLGPDARSAGQSLAALAVNSSTSLVAGAVLGSITGTLDEYPGLLVMVPAAIGLRGNVFSALGSRLSTSVHTGEYRPSLRRETVLGDNASASIALSLLLAVVLALVAKAVTVAFGIEGAVSVFDLATISVLGGALASAVVLAATLGLVSLAVRQDWDLDNLVAPVVSTLGDVVTVPALWLATFALGHGSISTGIGGALVALAVGLGVRAWFSDRSRLRRIVRESVPVLAVAATLSTLAGLVLQQQFEILDEFPALLVLQPAFVSSAGALGGLLSASLATGLHLGTVEPAGLPSKRVRRDIRVIAALAVAVYALNGLGANAVAHWLGVASPGAWSMLAAAWLGGAAAVAFVVAVAYYGTIAAVRLRVDPDSYGIPVVTSSVDFVGSVALIVAVTVLAIT
ncbi:MAG: magnesium transporter [Acidimicrobiales bacterium]|nr:magnesium transporter [Acidimicrobiales bacterium]